MRSLLLLVVLALAACTYTERVYLQHPNGQTATCGPFQKLYDGSAAVLEERGCVQDYQRQGYVRVPKP